MYKPQSNPSVQAEMEAKEKAVQARAEGRLKKAAKTAWELDVGQFKLRCVAVPEGFVVEVQQFNNGWYFFTQGQDSLGLLKRILGTETLASLIRNQETYARSHV